MPIGYPLVSPLPAHLPAPTPPLPARLHPLTALKKFQYNGGKLIKNVELFAFWWGRAWRDDTAMNGVQAQMNRFLTDYVSGTPMDLLAEYGTAALPIGRGQFNNPGLIITDVDPADGVTSAQIEQRISEWVNSLNLDANGNSLFMVFLPSGISTVAPWGARSCDGFAGYHWNFGDRYYAVIPYACCGSLNNLKVLSSHEIAEAVTGPRV